MYALSEMDDHLSLPRELYEPFADNENRENSVTHLRRRQPITGEYSARHSQGARQALGGNEHPNIYSLSDAENPAGGLTKEKSGTAPLPCAPQSGDFRPDARRPWRGPSAREMRNA